MHLRQELGHGSLSFAGVLAEEARLGSNLEHARLWDEVARELAALDRRGDGGERREPRGSVWGLMQRIEYYRHRAAEVERKATAAPEACRDDMLEVAEEWRDLALLADLQGRLNSEKAKLDVH